MGEEEMLRDYEDEQFVKGVFKAIEDIRELLFKLEIETLRRYRERKGVSQ